MSRGKVFLPPMGVAEVRALPVGTSKARGVHPLGGSSAAFDLTPGTYWRWRRFYNRRGSGGESTGRAIVWAAGPQQPVECPAHLGSCSRLDRTRMEPAKRPQPEQAEHEQGHEQEQKSLVKGHLHPLYLK
jgi:hypothetical protein